MGRARPTDALWYPNQPRPSGGARYDTLPIPPEEMEAVKRREAERKARGFGFAQRVVDEEVVEQGYIYPGAVVGIYDPEADPELPLLWEGDQA